MDAMLAFITMLIKGWDAEFVWVDDISTHTELIEELVLDLGDDYLVWREAPSPQLWHRTLGYRQNGKTNQKEVFFRRM